jgi:Putative Flp pilus-assembly TadE/G-like
MLTTARASGERGLIVVWFTVLLTVMVGLAALVVDLGVGREKSRQAQNAADAAALGAAQKLPDLTATVSVATALGNTNVSGATLAWAGCTDSGPLARPTTPPSCISFDNSFKKVRVRLPSQSLRSIFGGIFGVKALSVGKAAEAQVVRADVGGETLPFALYNDPAIGNEVCLKSDTHDCDASVTGNFGMLDIATYLDSCSGNQNSDLASNTATGIDHILTTYPHAAPFTAPIGIPDGCFIAGPNTVDTLTGNRSNPFDSGILSGSGFGPAGTTPALLRQGANVPKVSVAGNLVDNKPLWEFISPDASLSNVPLTCKHGGANGFDTKLAAAYATPAAKQTALHAQIRLCITQYNLGGSLIGCSSVPCTGVLFGANTTTEAPIDVFDIQQSPRFVEMPQMWETVQPTGTSSPVHVWRFQPCFLQRLLGKHGLDFEPGPWNTAPNPPPGGDTAEAIAAFKIPATMLPGNIGQPNVIGQTSYVQLAR